MYREEENNKLFYKISSSTIGNPVFILKQCVSWKSLKEEIREFIKKCELCQRFGGCRKNGPIQRIRLKEPFSLIGIDLVGSLPKTDKGNRYLIVATDYLSRWAEANAVKIKTADEV
ncbi:hypothetical protein ENBRE01_3471, partial [Enteropsectra breve]